MKRRQPSTSKSVERKHHLALPLLLITAFVIKATVLAQLGDHPLLQAHGELDTAYYLELARKVASGGPLAIAEPFFVSPLYVYALAAVFRLGGSIFAAQVLQILLVTAAVGSSCRTPTSTSFSGRSSARSSPIPALTARGSRLISTPRPRPRHCSAFSLTRR